MKPVVLGIKTISALNAREGHWGARKRRAGAHIDAVLWSMPKTRPVLPVSVTLTRLAPSNGLDGDNLQGSLKHVRDGVAKWLGIDDADPRVTWVYGQERCKAYAVRVEVA